MRFITPLIALMLCYAGLLTGCGDQMQQPVMDVISPPPQPTYLDMAREKMDRVNQRRTTAQQQAEAIGDFSTIFIDSETIFKEELGFRKGLWVELVEIYRDENADNAKIIAGFNNLQEAFTRRLDDNILGMHYFDYIGTFDELIIEYLRLSYVHPNMQETELLEQFRQSVKDDKVSLVFPDNF
ncbi:hypothetical protein F4212_00675 [Candidatus Poribacteria bacterium]|nr:hypothetical protein [Candidatus Poribacteria bacterium]